MTTTTTKTTTNSASSSTSMNTRPVLPPLYFTSAPVTGTADLLPSEVLHRCLAEYADWGDLARLACVSNQWSDCMYQAANHSAASKWQLAQALLQGTSGLAVNKTAAMKLLLELANLPTNNNEAASEQERLMPQKKQTTTTENNNTTTNNNSSDYHAPAMKQIANLYLTGQGITTTTEADPSSINSAAIGLSWLEAAYSWAGDVEAAHEVALIYEHGRHGVAQDVVAAVDWFHKAAHAGHVEAMAEVGLCYELGLAVEQSDEQALEWYMQAANAGHMTAKFSVGEIFEEARGVPQSDEEACLWYYRAAVEGCADSRKALRRLQDIARIVLNVPRAELGQLLGGESAGNAQ